MPLEIDNLDALDPSLVASEHAKATQIVQEANPSLDVRRGVVHDVILYNHAALAARQRTAVSRYESARSLSDIAADPTLADTGVVEAVLSNYRVARGDGANAKGEVTIVLSGPFSVTIGSGTAFSANGKSYTADAAFTAKAEADQINDASDRLLSKLDDGNWAFTVNVTAVEPGADAVVAKDTLVVPAALPTGYVTSYAASDFTGGLDPESNEDLLDKLQQGFATRAPGNRVMMQAVLRNHPDFNRIIRSSIIGNGDEEMIRDQHTIWPGSVGGGRVDWYVRTQERVQLLTLRLSCTLLSKTVAGVGTWQVGINRDAAPGFYEVHSVRPLEADASVLGTLTIASDTRGLDLSGSGYVPDIVLVAEGAYSRFQTAVIRFVDDTTDQSTFTAGDQRDYDVTVRVLPLIGQIQDFVSSHDARAVGADVLVKAPVPCFLQVSFTVNKTRRQADPDVAAIADAVAREVNTTDFSGRLYASRLQDVIQGFLPDGMSAGAIDMFGRLRYPDGTIAYVRDNEVLAIASVDGAMVSPRTVQFFLDPTDVAISVRAEIPVPQ